MKFYRNIFSLVIIKGSVHIVSSVKSFQCRVTSPAVLQKFRCKVDSYTLLQEPGYKARYMYDIDIKQLRFVNKAW